MSQGERSRSARGTEALQSCFCRPGRPSMTTGRLVIDLPSARRSLWRLQPPAPRASLPRGGKSGEINRGGDITPFRLRRSLFFVAPATPADPAAVCPAPPSCPGLHCSPRGEAKCVRVTRHESRNTNHGLYTSSTPSKRNEVMAVVSRASAVRRGEMQVRPRRREGASFSQIRCRNGRSVRPGCARVAPPKTAAQSLLPCSLLPGISRLLFTACLLTIARYCAVKKCCP